MRLGIAALFAGALLFAGCGDSEGTFMCSYEVRSSACGGGNWGDWEAGCETVDPETLRDDVDLSTYCNKYSGSDIECGGSCCINFEYRNATKEAGVCP